MVNFEYFGEWLENWKSELTPKEYRSVLHRLLEVLYEYFPDFVCFLDDKRRVVMMNSLFKNYIKKFYNIDLREGDVFLSDESPLINSNWKNAIEKAFQKDREPVEFNEFTSSDTSFIPQFFRIEQVPIHDSNLGLMIIGRNREGFGDIDFMLEERDKTFQLLTEYLRSAVFLVNDKGYFTYSNPAATTITGYSEDELRSLRFFDIAHPDFKELIRERGFSRLHGREAAESYEVKIIHKDGREKWIEISNTTLRLRNQFMVLGTAIDISARKETEEALKIERIYLENLFENSPEAIVVTTNEGIIEKINHEFTQLFCYSKDEAIGKHIDQLIATRECLEEAGDKTARVAKGERILAETVRKDKNGKNIPVSILGAPVVVEGKQYSVYGIYRDITERIQSKEALKESKSQLQYVLDNTKDIIFQMDFEGRFNYVNKAAGDITGFTADEFLSMSIFDLAVKPWHKTIRSVLHEVVSYSGIEHPVKFKIHKKTGEETWLELNTNPIIRNGYVEGIQGVARDVSERMAYEEQMRDAKEKAEAADHLKTAFLANMSHEIRTPMNAILGFSRLLKNTDISEKARSEYVDIINSRGNHLLQVINDIIDLSKIEANQLHMEKEVMNLNQFLDEFFIIFSQQIREEKGSEIDLKVTKALKEEEAQVLLDKTRFQQILTNMVNNAIKYTQKGLIEYGYQVFSEEKDPFLRFYVKDTGIGIPAEKQGIIFERFRQSDESSTRIYGGTGLGLSISKGLVDLMGGEIWVESQVGKGTVFYFTLPFQSVDRQNMKMDKSNVLHMKYDWSNKTILIVEDDMLSSKFLQAILEDTQARILFAKSGAEAITIAREKEHLDLILMDIQLPGISGNEATAKIREFRKDIPIIAQTAHAMSEDKRSSIEAGCDDYITKPINMEQLLSKIYQLFTKYDKHEEA